MFFVFKLIFYNNVVESGYIIILLCLMDWIFEFCCRFLIKKLVCFLRDVVVLSYVCFKSLDYKFKCCF